MKRRVLDLDTPDRFVAGVADGIEDETCYLQAVQGTRVISVALERQQIALLAHRVLLVVGELERRGLLAIEATPAAGPPQRVLVEPVREEFRVGTLTIGWDNDSSRVVVEAYALVFDAGAGESASAPGAEADDEDDLPDDDPLGPDVLRVRLTALMAQRFARQAGRLVG